MYDGAPTHISKTSIDLTLESPTVAPDLHWTTIPSVLSSDHYPIVITIATAIQPTSPLVRKYNFRKCNWKNYREGKYWMTEYAEPQNGKHSVEKLYKRLRKRREKWVPKYKKYKTRKYFAKAW